jgi:transposase
MKKKLKISMEVIHAHAAGIDIGSKSHWVAVDQNSQHVRESQSYNEYDYYQISQKRKNAQLKNIRNRIAKLNLTEMELKALIPIMQ